MQPVRMAKVAAVLIAALGVSACSSEKEPRLMNVASSNGNLPDEFSVLPNKPIEIPTDLAALPSPTPGGKNRVDPTPEADAIAALGGRPSRSTAGGVPSADSALITQASRFGTAAGIRDTLAAEDLEFRRDNDGRILERLFNVNVYFKAYLDQSLDQHAELLRWRRAGVRTVAAPPEEQ